MTNRRFTVFLRGQPVGHLEVQRGRLSFAYAPAASPDAGRASRLSVSLPYRSDTFDDTEARPYFENLLPEPQFRDVIARQSRLATADVGGILGAVAGECPGAVSIWPGELTTVPEGSYEDLAGDRLGDLFSAPDDLALIEEQRRGRLSLPGALPKLTLLQDGDTWRLARNGAPTTHILKRTLLGFPHLAENEYFCMQLADRCGVPVPNTFLLNARVSLLAVERFDRVAVEGGIDRLHQEDFCQATGTLPAAKYEADGGPGFEICASLLRQYSALPIADIAALIRWAVFNYLVGNEDAHGKNIALLHTADGTRLAPFFDIVSTEVYSGLQRKGAMAIGGERRFPYVRARHWKRFAQSIDVPARAVKRTLDEVSTVVADVIDDVAADVVRITAEQQMVEDIRVLAEDRVRMVKGELVRWDEKG